MKSLLTNYLCPLQKRIPLLSCDGLAFDNPRTPDEIAEIEQLLRIAIPDGKTLWSIFNSTAFANTHKFPKEFSEAFSLQATVLSLFERFPKDDEYVREFILNNLEEDPVSSLAKMWVCVRIDYNIFNDLQLVSEAPVEDSDIYTNPDGPEHILESRIYELIKFGSLLACPDEYWYGDSFLRERSPPSKLFNLGNIVFAYRLSTLPGAANDGLKPMQWFHEDLKGLLEAFSKIDQWLMGDDRELILYISNLIHASTNHLLTEKARLLLLVSAIELMLTHNPDFNRFNVEESINKQFLLKLVVLLHRSNPHLNISSIKEDLRHIYNLRSRIAHGDYPGLQKAICKKLSRSDYTLHMEEMHISKLNDMLYMYIKTVMEQYFDCRDFVRFLKDN